ncbi:uncharacterized protein [Palaemon carinicauda]|uniref:uncharacterized protein n=1 Tax=Palaemon carinicauda TaxID=392227 RepID=UPI0035B6629A
METEQEDFEQFVISGQDQEEIHNLIREAYVDREPLCVGLHITFEDFLPFLKKALPPTLESKVSLGVRKESDGKLVAFMLNRILLPRDNQELFGRGGFETEKANQYTRVLHDLCADVDILGGGRFEKQLELQCVCIHPDYSGRGLAMKLIQKSEAKGRALGCDVATIQAVSAITEHMAKKMGYTTVKKTDVKTLMDATGNPLLDLGAVAEGTGTTHFTYFMKKL